MPDAGSELAGHPGLLTLLLFLIALSNKKQKHQNTTLHHKNIIKTLSLSLMTIAYFEILYFFLPKFGQKNF